MFSIPRSAFLKKCILFRGYRIPKKTANLFFNVQAIKMQFLFNFIFLFRMSIPKKVEESAI
ncbi:MAG: hypothetical protein EBZ47_01140 [Chlamydiae bacterium]|nr:hypothetical protein [Chlamydiota bacterium]